MNEQNLQPTPIRSTEEAKRKGKAGGIASGKARRAKRQRLDDLLAAFGVEPLTAAQAREIDTLLLAMNKQQLTATANNEELPTYMRRRARLLAGSDDEVAFEKSDRMLDRAFGKPKQQVDMSAQVAPAITIANLGTFTSGE